MINNELQIRSMLSFTDKDDFYFVQIFKRRKDNPELERDQIVIDNFYIDSLKDFDKKLSQIITTCNSENARAYIRINKRNYKKLAPHFLKRVADIVFTENCKALRNTFDSIAGEHHSDPDKKWIVDVDWGAVFNQEIDGLLRFNHLIGDLSKLQVESNREPLLIRLPTKNGVHIITRPFNLQLFKAQYDLDVHKDNPSLLYCP
jgi:hypothetical protein